MLQLTNNVVVSADGHLLLHLVSLTISLVDSMIRKVSSYSLTSQTATKDYSHLGSVVTVNANDVSLLLLLSIKEACEDILDTIGVSFLGIECGTRVMGDHGVTTVLLLAIELHGSPWVFLGGCNSKVGPISRSSLHHCK